MFSVTYAQLNAWMTAFLWPFVRILALVATAPVFGNASVPTRVKIGLSASSRSSSRRRSAPCRRSRCFPPMGVWIIVNQFLIGAALGLTMQIVFTAIQADRRIRRARHGPRLRDVLRSAGERLERGAVELS